MRATWVQCVRAIESTMAHHCPRHSATMTTASNRCGNALVVSTRRMATRSTQPPRHAASIPTPTPSTVEQAEASSARSRESRSAWAERIHTSRPNWSVPKG